MSMLSDCLGPPADLVPNRLYQKLQYALVVCGRVLSFSGAWAGPRQKTIPQGSQKSAVKEDKQLFFTYLFIL
jgi:hypothetical protein